MTVMVVIFLLHAALAMGFMVSRLRFVHSQIPSTCQEENISQYTAQRGTLKCTKSE